jgi:multidrug efflux system membrane fusion protein
MKMGTRSIKTTLGLLVSLIATCFLLLACDKQAPQQAAPPQMPPPSVDVAQVDSQQVSDWKEFTGRMQASKSIVVMPRTSGYVVEVGFDDGAQVKKGDLLFQIDYRTIRAEVEQLKADVKRAEAEIELSERGLKRANSLRSTNAISQEQLDNRRTNLTQAKAEADSARADLKRSKVLHAITKVKAEFDGQASDARVEVGGSVVAGQTVLTTLVATDLMHSYFDVDESTYLRLQAQGFDYENQVINVQMGLSNQTEHSYRGRIDFVDNQVDSATGTIRMRAVFDNADRSLTPGLFARVKLQIGEAYEAIVIPEAAIATDLSSKYVLVVGENNLVEYRPVVLGLRKADFRVISSGIKAGETIIVSGLQRAFPGAPVTPVVKGKSAVDTENDEGAVSASES